MSTNNPIQTKTTTLLETMNDHFKCKLCNSTSLPIGQTQYAGLRGYMNLDIYVCEYCCTCFAMKKKADGFVERQDLSSEILKGHPEIPF